MAPDCQCRILIAPCRIFTRMSCIVQPSSYHENLNMSSLKIAVFHLQCQVYLFLRRPHLIEGKRHHRSRSRIFGQGDDKVIGHHPCNRMDPAEIVRCMGRQQWIRVIRVQSSLQKTRSMDLLKPATRREVYFPPRLTGRPRSITIKSARDFHSIAKFVVRPSRQNGERIGSE